MTHKTIYCNCHRGPNDPLCCKNHPAIFGDWRKTTNFPVDGLSEVDFELEKLKKKDRRLRREMKNQDLRRHIEHIKKLLIQREPGNVLGICSA